MINVATAIQNTIGIENILVKKPKSTNILQNNSANMVSCNEIADDTCKGSGNVVDTIA